MPGKAVTQAEFARLLGMNRSSVTRLKQAGRLVLTDDGLIDVDASRALMAETADPNRDDVAARHAATRGEETSPPPTAEGEGYQAARAKKERYLAAQAQLDYERSAGKLVERAEVEAAISDLIITFGQALDNMPQTVAPLVIAKDLDTIRATLRTEIRQLRVDLEKNCAARLQRLGEESAS